VPIGLWGDEKTQKTLAVLEAMHKTAETDGKEMLIKRNAFEAEV